MLSSAIEFSLLVWLVFANSTLPEFFDGFLPSALHLHHFRGLYPPPAVMARADCSVSRASGQHRV
ncbi:hypothetical protein B0T40_24820 [Chromobacterium haemolyticum]|uniref:hypothetical protein n=1 Tax=Chromobacterium haemolyticum TaxID=394935 RepID=UPI0009F03533